MPKLMMKQKVFSWGDQFSVKSEYDEELYKVKGEVWSLGKKLHVYDNLDRECIYIEQKLWSWKPRFFVYVNGEQVAEIVKEFGFKPRYSINGLNWRVEGNFWEHDYRILDGEREVANIHKAWMTWGDAYEIDIDRDEDALPALAVVLAIDCVNAQQAAAAASTSN